MTNGEKYRNEILALLEDRKKFAIRANNPTKIIKCNDLEQCRGCLFDDGTCDGSKTKWLISEYKEPIKLTRTEYLLLCHVYKLSYKYIARDKDGDISLYLDEPDKDILTEFWHGKEYEFTLFNNLFPFIKWTDDKPTSIKGILENCDVKGNMNGE